MKLFADMTLLAAVVVFVVDLSGFSQTVITFVSRVLGRRVNAVKPLTCSLCMNFWTCLLWALCSGRFCLGSLAWACALAFLSQPMGEALTLVREWVLAVLDKLYPKR